MGSQNWILNCDRQYRNTSPSFAPLDFGLTPQPASTNLQSSCLVYCAHDSRLPHSEPVQVDHDQQP
jgi:hypothetical protein